MSNLAMEGGCASCSFCMKASVEEKEGADSSFRVVLILLGSNISATTAVEGLVKAENIRGPEKLVLIGQSSQTLR